jgi:hypothetical protein
MSVRAMSVTFAESLVNRVTDTHQFCHVYRLRLFPNLYQTLREPALHPVETCDFERLMDAR